MALPEKALLIKLSKTLKTRSLPLLLCAVALVIYGVKLKSKAWAQASDESANYTITTFEPFSRTYNFTVSGIDNAGDVVGTYLSASSKTGYYEGYERLASGTYKGQLYDSSSYNTIPRGIDSEGTTIVGSICIECTNTPQIPSVQRRAAPAETPQVFSCTTAPIQSTFSTVATALRQS